MINYIINIVVILIFIIVYEINKKHLDSLKKNFKKFLNDNNDVQTQIAMEKTNLYVNKTLFLVNKYFETNLTEYLAYAICVFIINSLVLIVILFTVVSCINSFLLN